MSGPSREQTPGQHRGNWDSSPLLAWSVRALIFLTPILAAWLLVRMVSSVLFRPAGLVGLATWAAQATIIGLAASRLAERATHRFLPLATLLNMSLVFPDQAPSRFGLALRSGTIRQQQDRLHDLRTSGLGDSESEAAERAVELVTVLGQHDRLTRGHTERVRAYADLIAQELGLPDKERQKLMWGAMLHDIGKLAVRPEILNKEGKPDEEEWEILRRHPAAGKTMLAPLEDWLGEWLHAASQHHERWDGAGYPAGLAGNEIALAGRITAVADAYDVMTSRRSYKAPMRPAAARQELVRCSGTQFDPEIVRAFLRVSVGRRWKVGPLAWLAELPALGNGIAAVPSAVASTAAATAVVVGAAAAGVTPLPSSPDQLAFVEPASEVEFAAEPSRPTTLSTPTENSSVPLENVPMTSTTEQVARDTSTVKTAEPLAITTSPMASTVPTTSDDDAPVTSNGPTTTSPAQISTTTSPANTSTSFTTTVPPSTTIQTSTTVALTVVDDNLTADENKSIKILVLSNDPGDGSGFDLTTLVLLSEPFHSSNFRIHNDHLHYKPEKNYVGPDSMEYEICTNTGSCGSGTVMITVMPK